MENVDCSQAIWVISSKGMYKIAITLIPDNAIAISKLMCLLYLRPVPRRNKMKKLKSGHMFYGRVVKREISGVMESIFMFETKRQKTAKINRVNMYLAIK